MYLQLRRIGRVTLFFTNRNYCTVDFELMSIQDNLLSRLPDFQFNGNSPLVAESTAKLEIVNRDVIIDRLDPTYVSNENQPTCKYQAMIGSHLQLECPSIAHFGERYSMFFGAKSVDLNSVLRLTPNIK